MCAQLRNAVFWAAAFGLGSGGCASQPPLAGPPPRPEPSVPAPASPHPRPPLPAIDLAGPAGLRNLCDALRAADDVAFKGSDEEQERQRDAFEARRDEAEQARYVVELPSAGFDLAGYAPDEGRLRLSDRRFSVGDDASIDRPSPDEPIDFLLSAPAADRLLQLHTEGRLGLRLVFQPQPSQMRPNACLRQSGGRIVKLGAHILAAYLVGSVGAPLARFETDGFAQEVARLTPVVNPKVTLGKPLSMDATPVPPSLEAALTKLEGPLLSCYRKALAQSPVTQGTVVITAALLRDGRLQKAHVEMGTTRDQGLIDCALAATSARLVESSPGPWPSGISLPVTFGPGAG